jgi:hypothetical protein
MLLGVIAGASTMKKIIAFLSLTVGLVVLYFSYQAAEQKAENDAWLDALQTAKDAETALVELRKSVPDVPVACMQVKTQPFYDVCDLDPYEGQPIPAWRSVVKEADQSCVLQAFHTTNNHAFKFREGEYDHEAPSDMRVIRFSCAVSSASMFDDNLSIFDSEGSGFALLKAFYTERAETRWGPETSY